MKKTIFFLIVFNLCAFCGYDVATISNPTSALTDFILYVDLSRMSSSFRSAWNTDSNGYSRAYKLSDGTQLPTDLVWSKNSVDSGYMLIKWTGSLASSGTQQIIILPPNDARDRYSITDTYGKNNVYSGLICFFPLDGNGNERTGNGYNLTVSGATPVAGRIYLAYSFDGADDYLAEGVDRVTPATFQTGFTISTWINPTGFGESNVGHIVDKSTTGGGNGLRFLNYNSTAPNDSVAHLTINGYSVVSGRGSINIGELQQASVSVSSSGVTNFYINGAISGTENQSTTALSSITSTNPLTIGNISTGTTRTFYGSIDNVIIYSGVKSAAWIASEYLQQSNQSSFFGTWTWIPHSVDSMYPDTVIWDDTFYLHGNFIGLGYDSNDSAYFGDYIIPSLSSNDSTILITCPHIPSGWYGDTVIVCALNDCDTLVNDSIYVISKNAIKSNYSSMASFKNKNRLKWHSFY